MAALMHCSPFIRQVLSATSLHLTIETQEWLNDQGCANAAGIPLDDEWDVSLHMSLSEKGWSCRVPTEEESNNLPADLAQVCAFARAIGANYVLIHDEAAAISELPIYH